MATRVSGAEVGFFSGKKTVRVSSVIYNLAGDVAQRPSYIKSLVVRNILSGTRASMGDTLRNGYLKGPGIQLRAFYRWAKRPGRYEFIGQTSGSIGGNGYIDANALQPVLADIVERQPDQELWLSEARVGEPDVDYWAERWMLDNRPEALDSDWSATVTGNQCTITFADGSTATFPLVGYDPSGLYLYAAYELVTVDRSQPLVPGETQDLGDADPVPPDPTDGWEHLDDESTREEIDQVLRTTTTVGDGEPTVEERTETFVRATSVWRRDVYEGGTDVQTTRREWLYQTVDSKVVTVRTEDGDTVTEREELAGANSERTDTQVTVLRAYSGRKMFIYRTGSGRPELDALAVNPQVLGEFFPIIPVRINSNFLSEQYFKDAYHEAQKAYKKLTAGKFDDLVKKVADNKSIDDIDYVYLVPGVSLNVLDKSCRRYVYEFFDLLRRKQFSSNAQYEAWQQQYADSHGIETTWAEWFAAQSDPANPLYGSPEPRRYTFVQAGSNTVRIQNTGAFFTGLDMRIAWNSITTGEGVGQGKPGAKLGEFWWQVINPGHDGGEGRHGELAGAGGVCRLYWQDGRESFRWLELTGLVHHNFIYGKYEVAISAAQALADGDESGFIVPLHYETLRGIPLVHSTQVATQCCPLVFNCFEVHRQPWYTTWWFQIIVVVVVAIVSAVLTGGASIGLLGTALSVGTALGFSGITAAIIGSVINALAAMVLVSIIEKAATAVFGDIIGPILAVLAVIAIGNVSSNFQQTGNLAMNWGEFVKADNLLKMTNAVGNAWVKEIQADTLKIVQEAQDYARQADAESNRIQQAFLAEFGYGNGSFDPMLLIGNTDALLVESSDTFIGRTLMTGTDIASLSHDLLDNFAEFSLKLPDAFA